MMFVRLALESDTDDLVEMGRMNCEETCPGDTFSPERARQLVAEYIKTAIPTFFVVEHQRKVIGFLMSRMSLFDHKDGFYTTQGVIFVRPQYRGTRAAVLLMKELIAWSRRIGASEIHGGNDNSFRSQQTKSFLQHFGFEDVGFAMRKRLSDGQEGR